MLSRAFDLYKLYKEVFGNPPYYIPPKSTEKTETQEVIYSGIEKNPFPKGTIHYNKNNISLNKIGAYGKDIWFPIKLVSDEIGELEIDICTIAVNLTKTIVRTAVSERRGTVKECFNIDDYKFTIRGFFVGKGRKFPEDEIEKLKKIFESNKPVELHGGYPELFLDKSCRIAIETLEFPEVQGKAYWIRPFSFTCETDYVEDLINLPSKPMETN